MADHQRLTTDDRPRRPLLATIAAAAHVAMGLCCLATVVYMFVLMRSPEILKEKDAAAVVYGLKIGALVLALAALPYLLGGIGVWAGRSWGWVIGIASNAGASVVFIWDAIDQRYIDWDDATLAVVFPVLLIIVLLPPVRRWCWRRKRTMAVAVRERAVG